MVPRVPSPVAPEDRLALYKEQPRHGPGIAHRFAASMTFQGGADSSQPHARSEHLACAALADPEGGVESLWGIGNGARLWPVTAEECGTLGNRALVDEQQRGVGGIGSADSA